MKRVCASQRSEFARDFPRSNERGPIEADEDGAPPVQTVRLVDYQSLADELEEIYEDVTKGQTNLPAYRFLVTDRD